MTGTGRSRVPSPSGRGIGKICRTTVGGGLEVASDLPRESLATGRKLLKIDATVAACSLGAKNRPGGNGRAGLGWSWARCVPLVPGLGRLVRVGGRGGGLGPPAEAKDRKAVGMEQEGVWISGVNPINSWA